jgi:hypothetical protein
VSFARARQRYLQRHIEPGLPGQPGPAIAWDQVLVIPAYRESAALLQRLSSLPTGGGRVLVILVLNRPDSDPDPQANRALRRALATRQGHAQDLLLHLAPQLDIYLHDLDTLGGPIAASRGVGLARKIGCDIAFKWICEGAIASRWICSSDADARLPQDYFDRLDGAPDDAAAACYPFRHVAGADPACNEATALYELRLHHYVLGLEFAGSPYAWHALGSCLAVRPDAYAAVRGFPRRAGGEDFYLLNKVAKTGPVVRLAGTCIELESRVSSRVPFGTGPAVAGISAAGNPAALPLFYHPACYEALRGTLAAAPLLQRAALAELPHILATAGVDPVLARACLTVLDDMGTARALDHCRRQGGSAGQFLRQFHQWFDAFRTLKFIHGMRDAGWPPRSLADLDGLQPALWPPGDPRSPAGLCSSVAQRWGWQSQPDVKHEPMQCAR